MRIERTMINRRCIKFFTLSKAGCVWSILICLWFVLCFYQVPQKAPSRRDYLPDATCGAKMTALSNKRRFPLNGIRMGFRNDKQPNSRRALGVRFSNLDLEKSSSQETWGSC